MTVANVHIGPGWLWTAATIFPAVCILIVSARLATRHAQRISFGLEDWLVVPALIMVLGMSAMMLVGVGTKSMGYPTPKVPGTSQIAAESREQRIARKGYFIMNLISTPALALIKLSCVLFYRRIFGAGSGRIINTALYGLTVLIAIWGWSFFFVTLFGCGTHFDYYWTSQANQLKCPADLEAVNLSLAFSNFLLDTIIFIFPIPLVWKLQIPRGKKLLVLLVFALGGLSVSHL
jgi:hypothetical protein